MGYRIRELRPTAHAVITASMVILASLKARRASWIDEPVVIRSSTKMVGLCEMSERDLNIRLLYQRNTLTVYKFCLLLITNHLALA